MLTKLEEIENYKDQPKNHWKSAREIIKGYTGHSSCSKIWTPAQLTNMFVQVVSIWEDSMKLL
jgi:hypothetical protein